MLFRSLIQYIENLENKDGYKDELEYLKGDNDNITSIEKTRDNEGLYVNISSSETVSLSRLRSNDYDFDVDNINDLLFSINSLIKNFLETVDPDAYFYNPKQLNLPNMNENKLYNLMLNHINLELSKYKKLD